METGRIADYPSLYLPENLRDVSRLALAELSGHHGPSRSEAQALVVPSLQPELQGFSSQHDGVLDLGKEHLWIVGLLSGITIVLVVLSCSFKSSYFQENYLVTRAKEWVHLPLLRQPAQESLLPAAEAGATGQDDDDGPSPAPVTVDPVNLSELCSWVSETKTVDPVSLKQAEMKSGSDEVDSSDDQEKLVPDMSALSLSEAFPIPAAAAAAMAVVLDKDPVPASPRSKGCFAKSKDHFVFSNADMFLTKSESLDEARKRTDPVVREHKCIKANKSVDEILTKQLHGRPPGIESTQSASFGTPKCRKLQERRGSNHSLTIAVTAAETTLPTVTTPRECSAAQFLLTAGNSMNRRQLRSCLKDVNAIHAEFWSIPTNVPESMEQVVARKNRYRYVLPNPHSRVKLPAADPSDPVSGYINANYVRAHNGDGHAYIATQGPLSNTINDFWLMVWTERAPAIVMITRLVESGKAKCDPYLPEDGQEAGCQYGDVSVSVDSVQETEGYTVRHLSLKFGEEVRRTVHYWYTDWPDHKTPDNPRTLVQLAVDVETLRRGQGSCLSSPVKNEIGPVVVHCSAGVGRTGCFIALCQGLSQLVADGTVDILSIVCALRCDRGGMVQTAEQYEFIHRGLCLFERSTLSDYDGN